MPSFKSVFLSVTALAAMASAKTIKVTATSDNKFDPETVEADKGDTIEFHFDAKNSSVVAGNYEFPCSPVQLGTGFWSGFVLEKDNKVFQVNINNTDPVPFYSSQGTQCPKGMVGIINPSKNKTLDDYKKRAAGLSSGVSPGPKPFGGDLVDAKDADKGGDDKDSKDDKGSDSKKDDNKDNAAGSLHMSLLGLASAVGLAVLLA